MIVFFKKEKIIILATSIVLMLSLFSTNRAEAQSVQSANAATASGLCTAATDPNAVTSGLAAGNGPLIVNDPGVRYNTLQSMCSTVGAGPGLAQRQNVENAWYYVFLRVFLRMVTQSIVSWINSGFEGSPSFIQDPKSFLEADADQTIGSFIQNSKMGFLCKPFQLNIKLALGLQYNPSIPEYNCSLTDVLNNTKGAYQNFLAGDFIGGGGWNTWLQITTVPQNNQLGAMVVTQGALDVQLNNQSLLKNGELNWNKGFLSMKECTKVTKNPAGNVISTEKYQGDSTIHNITSNVVSAPVGTVVSSSSVRDTTDTEDNGNTYDETCQIVTPGTLISDQAGQALNFDTNAINLATDINQIFGALENFVVQKVMNEGLALVKSNELSPNDPSWLNGITQMQSQVAAGANNAVANPTTDSVYQPDPTQVANDYNNAQALAADQTNLLAVITATKLNEQNYLNAFNSIYTDAATTTSKFSSVQVCYSNELVSTSLVPPLTQAEIASSTYDIDYATTTVAQMNLIMSSSTIEIQSAQNNISLLQSVYNDVNSANVTQSTLNDALNSLQSIIPTLHTATSTAIAQQQAQNFASTTISQTLPLGDSMLQACRVSN